MKNKKLWLGILVLALVFGMLTSCSSGDDPILLPPVQESDIWSNVTSFSQLNGTWKAEPYSIEGSIEDLFYGDCNMTISSNNYKITFNSTAKTMTESGSETTTYSGENIDKFWPSIKHIAEYNQQYNQQEGITVSINDANYSITETFNNVTSTLDRDIIEYGMQINQNGTKLKMMEIIFTKE